MRRNADARQIKVNKTHLIARIKLNKENHLKDYTEAVEAFKKEAAEQLQLAQQALTNGEFKEVKLKLTVPENRADEYDKLVQMFEWELAEEVELSQGEFNEYIFDELDFAIQSRLSNIMYKQKWIGK